MEDFFSNFRGLSKKPELYGLKQQIQNLPSLDKIETGILCAATFFSPHRASQQQSLYAT